MGRTIKLLTIALLLISQWLLAQTPISGIINSYTRVTAIEDCTAKLTVSSSASFQVGDAVVLIQMQGAIINASDGAAFGDVQELNGAGLFEINEVSAVSGTTISLRFNLQNEYKTDGSVQLVSMPTYEDATVTADLLADPWNGQTGGILALKVNNQLTLNADLDASGAGFRGGQIAPHENPCVSSINNANAFFFASGDWKGAEKGEGISAYIPSKEYGRGAQANGGGGGNDHNSGGGGGAHVGAGGIGGQHVTSLFSTACKGENPGRGGKVISNLENRMFMGGGGGAGHSNNASGTDGGNGGGIVILLANEIQANGNRILANGLSAEDGTGGDGAGGGGAGGTILLQANTVNGEFGFVAEGGNGGSIDHRNRNDCFGPGGGAGGGRILMDLSNNNLSTMVAGGLPGLVLNSTRNCNNSTNGASAGVMGSSASYALPPVDSSDLAGNASIITQPSAQAVCNNSPTVIEVVVQGADLEYQWQVDQGDGFQNISDNDLYSGVQTPILTINSVTEESLDYRYLLVISSACGNDNLLSNFITLSIFENPEPAFTFSQNELTFTFNNITQGEADRYFWDFGDGDTSTMVSPVHTYAEDGQYTVRLNVITDCGTFTASEFIGAATLPTAGFNADVVEGCAPLSVRYNNLSTSNADGFLWNFEGGTPATSTAENPVITYETGGEYNVQLIVGNEAGFDTLTREEFVFVNAGPSTNFFVTVDELDVDFSNTTVNGDTFVWDFGDGFSSDQFNVQHTYDLEGEYIATLIATNECGSNTYTLNFTTGSLPNADFTADRATGCAPMTVEFEDRSSGTNVSNWQWTFENGNPTSSTDQNPIVQYDTPGNYKVSLTVSNNLGMNTRITESFVNVFAQPDVDFSFEVQEGGRVVFTNNSTNAASYGWNFGDGNFSEEENPIHTFNRNGLFSVTLNASNGACGSGTSIPVNVTNVSGIDDLLKNAPDLTLLPNPTTGNLTLEIAGDVSDDMQLRLFDVQGKLIYSEALGRTTQHQFDIQAMPEGIYLVQLIGKDWIAVDRIMKRN